MNCIDKRRPSPPTRNFRVSAGVHWFKSFILGGLSIPGSPQWTSVNERIQWLDDPGSLDERTWNSWFLESPAIPQTDSVDSLNRLARQVHLRADSAAMCDWNEAAFSELMLGGVMRSLAARVRSRSPAKVLLGRASDYRAPSTLCRHFDAVDAAAWGMDVSGVSAATVRELAAHAILASLELRWGRPDGCAYREFPSPLKRRLDAASVAERKKIRKSYAQTSQDLFDALLVQGDFPDWELTGVRENSPAWETLFALTADTTFLRHEDTLSAWVLDLVAAGLAEHALALSNPARAYSGRMTRTFLIVATTYQCFFSVREKPLDDRLIRAAMSLTDANWSNESFDVLRRAREAYHSQLRAWHISPSKLWSVASSAGNPFHPYFEG